MAYDNGDPDKLWLILALVALLLGSEWVAVLFIILSIL